MKYLDEVCDLLLADGELKYATARDKLNRLEKQVTNQHALVNAKKNQVKAAKEYLEVIFKAKFLEIHS
tara:strand:+ start:330 stop:533 length:204 start_codon:yes stop_codon:yes gene_type:complete